MVIRPKESAQDQKTVQKTKRKRKRPKDSAEELLVIRPKESAQDQTKAHKTKRKQILPLSFQNLYSIIPLTKKGVPGVK